MEDNQPNDDLSNSDNGVNDKKDQAGSKQPNDEQSEAYRKQQARADKAQAENEELTERLATLEEVVVGDVKKKLTKDFLRENKEKYPDVKTDDLIDLIGSPDDLERVADKLQKRFEQHRTDTLAKVREVPEDSMTQAEKDKQLADLKEKPSANSFADYLKIATTKLRK